MKTRILTGLVAGAAALAVLLLLPNIATFIMMALLSAMAVYEMIGAVKLRHCRELLVLCLLMALAVPFFPYMSIQLMSLVLCASGLLLTGVVLYRHETVGAVPVVGMGLLTLLISSGLSSVAHLRGYDHGLAMVFLALLIPWMSDTGAYFTGVFFGKHKLCPKISPKKTIEGFVGGIVSSVVLCTLFAWLYGLATGADVILWRVALLCAVGAPISVLGDLFASVIKRQHNVKDYGWILPGHGGIMDRFDSVIFVAPVVVLWIQWLPLVG